MIYGSAKQFQRYDQLLIDEHHWCIEDMVFEAAKALYKHIDTKKKILIICGKGNNGADGLALSTLIKKNVVVYLLDDNLSQSSKHYLELALSLEIPIKKDFFEWKQDLCDSEVVVDAIFGTGFKGKLPQNIANIIQDINDTKNKTIISVDIPSGLDADFGTQLNGAIQADFTISFMAKKLGFLNSEALPFIGRVIVENILHDDHLKWKVGFSKLLLKEEIEPLLKHRLYNGYKGTYGLLSCYVGSENYPGAALLSIGSALHTGCGLVHFSGEASLQQLIVSKYPEVICKKDVPSCQAILFGCGKGWNDDTKNDLINLINNSTCPILIDADGINCLSENIELLKTKKAPVIITPHIGEMKRLMEGDSTLSAIQFARNYNVIVVLKGPKTFITDGNRFVRIPAGNKAMAVAGMGDCLAGIIASLLAQSYDPFEAAILGTYIHGYSGDIIADLAYTVLPSQLIKIIPETMKLILEKSSEK